MSFCTTSRISRFKHAGQLRRFALEEADDPGRPAPAAGQGDIGRRSRLAGALEVADDDGIEAPV